MLAPLSDGVIGEGDNSGLPAYTNPSTVRLGDGWAPRGSRKIKSQG